MKKRDKSSETMIARMTPAQVFLLLCLSAALFAAFKVIQPYIGAIVMAGLVASLFQPVHEYFLKVLHHRKNAASILSCTVLVFVVLIPLSLVGVALVDQGISVSQNAQQWIKSGKFKEFTEDDRWQGLMEKAEKYTFGVELKNLNIPEKIINSSSTLAKFILDQSGSIAATLSHQLMNFGMMVFVFFFFIRDGGDILDRVLHLTPLSTSQETRIIDRVKEIARSVFLGTILTALAQGVAAGIGFAICGIPALFWGSMLAFASLVPVIGTALIWIPATAYMFVTGETAYGIFLGIYCIVVVGSVDNFLRPVFMQGAGGMSTFMIFLSVIGGMQLFGVSGILHGPLVFGLCWVLLIIYEIEFEDYLSQQDRS